MKRSFLAMLVIAVLAWPFAAAAQKGGGRGAQSQGRMQSSGRGQRGGDQLRQRDCRRDGTGANCPGCPSLSSSTSADTGSQAQNQGRNRNQGQNRTRTQGGTQNQVRTEQQQQTGTNQPQ